MKYYDTVIIGAGVSGLFAAISLAEHNQSVLVIDCGKPLDERLASLGQNIATNQTIDRYIGFAGLGLSEGKYNYTNDFGGTLAQKIGYEASLLYQQNVDQLLCHYGAQQRPLYSTFEPELANRAAQFGFNVLSTQTRHLGSDLSIEIWQKLAQYLESKIEFMFNAEVVELQSNDIQFTLLLSNQQTIQASKVIIAVGRSGIHWLESIAQSLKLEYEATRLDLGFRIEMHNQQLDSLLKKTLETKLHYQTADYSATTYCMNPSGRVITKHQAGLVMPDGQNSLEMGPSDNLNFTLFIPKWFATRQLADEYLQLTINTINQQQGIIAAQRLGDIDRRFCQRRQWIEPTLTDAVFTDLSAITKDNYLQYSCDFLFALEKLLGQPIDGNTILYAMDCKSYSPVFKTDSTFATSVANLYLIGDCSGISSSLSQAAASGLFVANQLI